MNKFLFICFLLFFCLPGEAKDIKYIINDILTISVSDEMELRKEDDAYTKWMNNVLECTSEGKIVFQQKGLADFDKKASTRYARILIKTEVDEECGFPAYNDSDISEADIKELEEYCSGELAPGQSFLTKPKGEVEETGKGARIKIGYKRTGTQGAVCVQVLYYFNYRFAAKVVASYRESEEGIWQTLIERAVNSIEWDEPFTLESTDEAISQNETEIKTEEKSEDVFDFVLGLLVCLFLVTCVFKLYRKFKTVQAEEREIGRKNAIGLSINIAHMMIWNGDIDKADNYLKEIKESCREKDSKELEKVEMLQKLIKKEVEKNRVDTIKIVEEDKKG